MDYIDDIKWNDDGLVPVITQDLETGRVLMFAWMNHEALRKTVNSRVAVYWSRSRKRLWQKGERSGHQLRVREMRLDCDGDVILIRVESKQGIACHTGRESCFFRVLEDNAWLEQDPVLKTPEEIYGIVDNE